MNVGVVDAVTMDAEATSEAAAEPNTQGLQSFVCNKFFGHQRQER